MLFKALRIDLFGIEGHTLDIIIFFAGLMSLRICIMCSFIVIVLVFSKSVSNISLLDRKTQKRLFDILDVKIMCFGNTIFPIARM